MKLEELKEKQKWSLDKKIEYSLQKISTFYDFFDGKVYVSFSGGKDSTVLLHLVRSLYPEVPGVFVDTGLEYPEVRDFVKTKENIIWLKPKKTFLEIIQKYGYPVISKEQSYFIEKYRNAKSDRVRNSFLNGRGNKGSSRFKIAKKWAYLVNAPFKISNKCCFYMKKQPIKKFEKKTGLKPYIGTMATESFNRQRLYLQYGCLNFSKVGNENCTPLGFWTEQDIWDYIKLKNIEYSNIYDLGVDRTGCIYCMFGAHKEEKSRFIYLKKYHPKLFDYCMNKLGLKKVLEYLHIQVLDQNSLEDY